jgi:hypothetical protein
MGAKHSSGIKVLRFFISRHRQNQAEVLNIAHTIIYQLAEAYPTVCAPLLRAVNADPALLRDIAQFSVLMERFFFEPLRSAPAAASPASGLIIIIDALDECNYAVGLRALLKAIVEPLFATNRVDRLAHVKVFLTGRPDPSVQATFDDIIKRTKPQGEGHLVVKLHEIDKTRVEPDIRAFYQHNFERIREAHVNGDELGGWPSAQDFDRLVARTANLFIFAATVIRSVEADVSSPKERLSQILGATSVAEDPGKYFKLDLLYRDILDRLLGPNHAGKASDTTRRVQRILSIVFSARTAATIEQIATLLDLEVGQVRPIVRGMSSVLLFENPDTVRVFHPSFPDFIRDPDRCNDLLDGDFRFKSSLFHFTTTDAHEILTDISLSLMNARYTRPDICRLQESPSASYPYDVRRVGDFEVRRNQSISWGLRYASCNWLGHFADAFPHIGDTNTDPKKWTPIKEDLIVKFVTFCEGKLLYWTEAMLIMPEFGPLVDPIRYLSDRTRVSTYTCTHARLLTSAFLPTASRPETRPLRRTAPPPMERRVALRDAHHGHPSRTLLVRSRRASGIIVPGSIPRPMYQHPAHLASATILAMALQNVRHVPRWETNCSRQLTRLAMAGTRLDRGHPAAARVP